MQIITSYTDLATWARDHALAAGGNVSDGDDLAEAIQFDDHPAWGADWTDYLGRVDVVQSVLSGHLIVAVEAWPRRAAID